ncbi:MAG: hypothetical protein AAFQ94_31055 [Bacteroidota bacterium]
MRFLEIILLLTVTILPFVKRPLSKHLRQELLLIFPSALLILHLVVEGWRWQMASAYILVLLLLWRLKVLKSTDAVKLSFKRAIGFFLVIVLMSTGWVLPNLLPVFDLPQPAGNYQVGTKMIHVKTSREEVITEDPKDKREFMVKVWYPATIDVDAHESEAYEDYAGRSGFATNYGLPKSALHYLDYIETHAYQDVPVAPGSFPVLIFSHGFATIPTGYYALLSEIASQGYVIININHTYESLGTTFPDGRIAYFDKAFNAKNTTNFYEEVGPVIEAFKNGLSYEERHPIVRKGVKVYFEGRTQNRWAEDVISVLDLLETWNQSDFLRGRLALDKIGTFGHSVGGGTAGNVAMKDQRIKAAVNLDGIQWGNQIDTLYHIPYLFVSADWPAEHEDISSHVYINKGSDYFYEAKILNSGHPNFMDIPFMVPVKSLTGNGEIDAKLGIEITTKLVTAFFDKHLKNTAAEPRQIADQYALLELKIFEGDSVR